MLRRIAVKLRWFYFGEYPVLDGASQKNLKCKRLAGKANTVFIISLVIAPLIAVYDIYHVCLGGITMVTLPGGTVGKEIFRTVNPADSND